MITDEDKSVGHSKGTKAGGQGDLRSFIDDAVVELPPKEEWAGPSAFQIE